MDSCVTLYPDAPRSEIVARIRVLIARLLNDMYYIYRGHIRDILKMTALFFASFTAAKDGKCGLAPIAPLCVCV